ncbi:hypothetical protein NJF44_01320 [Pseudomonas guariconensis]|uniref:hypothetical protein n=1 Tax=Pseudomonas TaxID=286 RepID=UPI0020981E10|nr:MULTISPECIES: hypothetical protein [Pseudomonas]MCO7513716.1 hypothetical protein [Pseudomonas putida]MCO7603883.1 hypothetical protein [Pseudomonas guariconensis]
MSSVVEICNMALSHIGHGQRIDDLAEASLEAEQCSLFYEHARDFVLRADCDWGFATAFAQLAEVATNPNPEFPYAYAVPNDCMRVRRILPPAFPQGFLPHDRCMPAMPEIKFRIINGSSQRLISTTVSPATLEYTIKIESSEMFDPIFVSALSWYLASLVAAPLAKDTSVALSCYQQYQGDVLRAAAAALNEDTAEQWPESSFITGRY